MEALNAALQPHSGHPNDCFIAALVRHPCLFRYTVLRRGRPAQGGHPAYQLDGSAEVEAGSMAIDQVFWTTEPATPRTLPSIITGATVGMGITWMVLVAAEMIAGRSGIGFLTWESYTGGDIPQVVVGMVSMGIGGAICSAVIWRTTISHTPLEPTCAAVLENPRMPGPLTNGR